MGVSHSWWVTELADKEIAGLLPQPWLAGEHRRNDSDDKHWVPMAALPSQLPRKPLFKRTCMSPGGWTLIHAHERDSCHQILLLVCVCLRGTSPLDTGYVGSAGSLPTPG